MKAFRLEPILTGGRHPGNLTVDGELVRTETIQVRLGSVLIIIVNLDNPTPGLGHVWSCSYSLLRHHTPFSFNIRQEKMCGQENQTVIIALSVAWLVSNGASFLRDRNNVFI